jgi:integration host factor subunit alpha
MRTMELTYAEAKTPGVGSARPFSGEAKGRFQPEQSSMRSVGTLTRADLAEAINRTVGLSRAESLSMVEAILRHMCQALSHGENVKISGFGTFLLRDKAERVGRNPKTGVEVPITPRRVLTFRASQMLKDRIAVE